MRGHDEHRCNFLSGARSVRAACYALLPENSRAQDPRTHLALQAARLALVALLATVASGCSSQSIATDCEESTLLRFEPALSADGQYEITVDVDGVRATCSAPIVDGQIVWLQGCSTVGARAGLDGFEVELGGVTQTATDTTLEQSGARTIEGIRWRGLSTTAAVVIERDGVETPTGPVIFQSETPPTADCSAGRMVGTVVAN